jgi:hypothetical protein
MREFVSAGGELIILGALHLKNSPIPELSIKIMIELRFTVTLKFPVII